MANATATVHAVAQAVLATLVAMGFDGRVELAHSWMFHMDPEAPVRVNGLVGMAEEAAWMGDHPRDVIAHYRLRDGYTIEAIAYVTGSDPVVNYVGLRPDGSDVTLDAADVPGIIARFG